MAATAVLGLWLPWAIVAHVFAAIWVLKTLFISRAAYNRQQKGTSSAQLMSLPVACAVGARQNADYDTCITISDCDTAIQRGTDQNCSKGAPETSKVPPRPAALQQSAVTLSFDMEWQEIGCRYKIPGCQKTVLQDIWGKAFPGEMQALMGPSGAGKSTLMDILAMRKSVGDLTGQLLLDGRRATKIFVKQTAYIPQDDNFVPTMTAQETLTFYASVLLPKATNRSGRDARIQAVLAAMGISHVRQTLVGGSLPGGLLLRGLSGGERRRLTIATGILSVPSVLFLDEPTSGLDSFAALSVMGHLKGMAVGRRLVVICSIHQPRSAIWEMFDRVTLLASGRLMYHGAREDLSPWFNSLGYSRLHGDEADWVLDLVAIGFDKPKHYYGNTMQSLADVHAAADAFKARYLQAPASILAVKDCTAITDTSGSSSSLSSLAQNPEVSKSSSDKTAGCSGCSGDWPSSALQQFWSLLQREVMIITRNPFDVAGRTLTCAWIGILWGIMFYNTPSDTLTGLRNRMNLTFAMLQTCILLPFVSISLYTADKRFYLADASANLYRASSYYAAKVVATTPFMVFYIISYVMIVYGMAGLRTGADHVAKCGSLAIVLYLIAIQVSHFSAVISPNQDITLCLMVTWTAFSLLLSSYFVNFAEVTTNSWFTQLRYISAVYFAVEAQMINEFQGTSADCSQGLEANLLQLLKTALPHLTGFQQGVVSQLGRTQDGCVVDFDAFLGYFQYSRPFATSLAILIGYLGLLHIATYVALVAMARREAR